MLSNTLWYVAIKIGLFLDSGNSGSLMNLWSIIVALLKSIIGNLKSI